MRTCKVCLTEKPLEDFPIDRSKPHGRRYRCLDCYNLLRRKDPYPPNRILSLGAGVQSSTVLMMMKHGEIKSAEVAIFADTGWEPKAVYDWLDTLEKISPIPIIRTSHGNIREDALDTTRRFASMPLHILNKEGGHGMLKRQCTREYKITPIEQAIRAHVGVKHLRTRTIETVIGISYDEIHRMKKPRMAWQRNVYPLVDMQITRQDCKTWMREHGYPEPPRSACIGCPFRRNVEWAKLTAEEFSDAVEFDEQIRRSNRFETSAYLHNQLIPLREVNLGVVGEDDGTMFDAECEGMCGL